MIDYFVPGGGSEDLSVAMRLRWPIPAGVAREYVQAYAQPEDLVVIPYCQGASEVREGLEAGRRVLAVHYDPLIVAVLHTVLAPVTGRELDAAVARLGDSLKQGVPLRLFLRELYAVTCPACQRPAAADYFLWHREQTQPFAKQLRCRECGWEGQAAWEPEDESRLAGIPDGGMHYHYVRDRVAPEGLDGAVRGHLEPLLNLYSRRNLYALAELALRIESLFPAGPLQRTLHVMLLDCLERCSSLMPMPGASARQHSYTRTSRFVERNVWIAFEEAASRLRSGVQAGTPSLAGTLDAFLSSAVPPAGFLDCMLVRDLHRAVPQRSASLILFSPPPLEPAAWALSCFWGSWLLGPGALTTLHWFLRQRNTDPAWYAGAMAGSLHALADLLRDDGRLVMVLSGQRPSVAEALLQAAASARLGLRSLTHRDSDYRLELALAGLTHAGEQAAVTPVPATRAHLPALRPTKAAYPDLEAHIRQDALRAAHAAIRARGEPVPWPALHAAIQRRLSETGWPAVAHQASGQASAALALVAEQVQSALKDPSLVWLASEEWRHELAWLADAPGLEAPLADRVESAAYEVLCGAESMAEVEFNLAVCARFPGPLAPEAALVAACLHSFGLEIQPGRWQLRPEERRSGREPEQKQMVEHLLELGRRLSYRASSWPPFDLAWSRGGQVRSAFLVRWLVPLGEILPLSDRAPGVQPYLVTPGGRSALLGHKLARNPLWQHRMEAGGWRFVKYRHVRDLLAQPDVDEYALRTIVGLDPIVEHETVQLTLF